MAVARRIGFILRAAFWLLTSLGYGALAKVFPGSDRLRYGWGAAEGIARVLWLRATDT